MSAVTKAAVDAVRREVEQEPLRDVALAATGWALIGQHLRLAYPDLRELDDLPDELGFLRDIGKALEEAA